MLLAFLTEILSMTAVWGDCGHLRGAGVQNLSEHPGPLDRVLHCYIPLRGPCRAARARGAAAWSPGWHHLLSQT